MCDKEGTPQYQTRKETFSKTVLKKFKLDFEERFVEMIVFFFCLSNAPC